MLKYQITFPEISSLAKESEANFENNLSFIVSDLLEKQPEVLLISGPSGSGKTTSSKKIQDALAKEGKSSLRLSLDDFFFDIKDRKNKTTDLESIELLDIDLLSYVVHQLASGEPTHIPTFDFGSQKRLFDGKQKIINKGDLLIVEGIHALMPELVDMFDDMKYATLYISVEGSAEFEDGFHIDGREIRMMRRMVRDMQFRDASPEYTLEVWKGVVASEKVNIEPYKDNADYVIDSFFAYEPYVIKKLLIKALEKIDDDGEYASVKAEFLPFAKKLSAASGALIPENSLLREFIG